MGESPNKILPSADFRVLSQLEQITEGFGRYRLADGSSTIEQFNQLCGELF